MDNPVVDPILEPLFEEIQHEETNEIETPELQEGNEETDNDGSADETEASSTSSGDEDINVKKVGGFTSAYAVYQLGCGRLKEIWKSPEEILMYVKAIGEYVKNVDPTKWKFLTFKNNVVSLNDPNWRFFTRKYMFNLDPNGIHLDKTADRADALAVSFSEFFDPPLRNASRVEKTRFAFFTCKLIEGYSELLSISNSLADFIQQYKVGGARNAEWERSFSCSLPMRIEKSHADQLGIEIKYADASMSTILLKMKQEWKEMKLDQDLPFATAKQKPSIQKAARLLIGKNELVETAILQSPPKRARIDSDPIVNQYMPKTSLTLEMVTTEKEGAIEEVELKTKEKAIAEMKLLSLLEREKLMTEDMNSQSAAIKLGLELLRFYQVNKNVLSDFEQFKGKVMDFVETLIDE